MSEEGTGRECPAPQPELDGPQAVDEAPPRPGPGTVAVPAPSAEAADGAATPPMEAAAPVAGRQTDAAAGFPLAPAVEAGPAGEAHHPEAGTVPYGTEPDAKPRTALSATGCDGEPYVTRDDAESGTTPVDTKAPASPHTTASAVRTPRTSPDGAGDGAAGPGPSAAQGLPRVPHPGPFRAPAAWPPPEPGSLSPGTPSTWPGAGGHYPGEGSGAPAGATSSGAASTRPVAAWAGAQGGPLRPPSGSPVPLAPDGPGFAPYGYPLQYAPGPLAGHPAGRLAVPGIFPGIPGYGVGHGAVPAPVSHGAPPWQLNGGGAGPGFAPAVSSPYATVRSGMATAALVLGIVAPTSFLCGVFVPVLGFLFFWPVAFLTGLLAVILGAVARSRAKRGTGGRGGQALAGFVCGLSMIAGMLVLVVLAAVFWGR